MYIVYNPNPSRKLTGDCVIRAITLVTNSDWKSVYMNIAVKDGDYYDSWDSGDEIPIYYWRKET